MCVPQNNFVVISNYHRNEAWKFMEVNGGTTPMSKVAARVTFRGLGIALAAMAVTILYDKATHKGGSHGHHWQ